MNLRPLTPRESRLAVVVAVAIAATFAVRAVLLPAYDEWSFWRRTTAERSEQHARLTANFALRDPVRREFETLGPESVVEGSDEASLSAFLRDIEIAARYPGMTVLSLRPVGMARAPTHRAHNVRLVVAGRLDEIVRLIGEIADTKRVVDLHSFALRGQPTGDTVEATFDFSVIRLETGRHPQGPASGGAGAGARESRREKEGDRL